MAFLLLLLLLPAHFLHQTKTECRFFNGTQRLRFLDRQMYGQQEIDRFDSDRGEFEAVTPLGQRDADKWNSDQVFLQYAKDQVESLCRYNYEGLHRNSVIGRRAKPSVTISPTKMDPTSPHTILLCTAMGFYPMEIEVQWLKNGEPEKEGVAFGEELQNGDWTYQLQVMLETQPQRGTSTLTRWGMPAWKLPSPSSGVNPSPSSCSGTPSCPEKGGRDPPCGERHNGPSWGKVGPILPLR